MNRCKVCGGKLINNKIRYKTHWRDRSIGIQGISALVCTTCGQAYIDKHMASNLNHLEKPWTREEFLKNPAAYMKPEDNFSGDGDRV